MSPQSQPLLSIALKLPPIKRAELVERLLTSFETTSRKKMDALWAREAEDRLDAFEQGKIKTVSANDVFKGRGRLARESAKLNPKVEQGMADEGLAGELKYRTKY